MNFWKKLIAKVLFKVIRTPFSFCPKLMKRLDKSCLFFLSVSPVAFNFCPYKLRMKMKSSQGMSRSQKKKYPKGAFTKLEHLNTCREFRIRFNLILFTTSTLFLYVITNFPIPRMLDKQPKSQKLYARLSQLPYSTSNFP